MSQHRCPHAGRPHVAKVEPLEERILLSALAPSADGAADEPDTAVGLLLDVGPQPGAAGADVGLPGAPGGLVQTLDAPLPHGEQRNVPIGEAVGLYPGRVVWVRDPAATTGEVTWDNANGFFWDDDHNNQAVIDAMLSKAIRALAGETDDADAWDALFRHFNLTHGRGDQGYQPGEKIVIKINQNTNDDYTTANNESDVTPHAIRSLLRQLVYQLGVAQSDIVLYDSIKCIHDKIWDRCHGEFPDVIFADMNGQYGRAQCVATAQDVIFYGNGQSDKLPTVVVEADYMINFAILKKHDGAGVTLCGKNHFGSLMRTPAHLHTDAFKASGSTMDQYSPFVDYMGHEQMGGKTVLYLIDALWGGWNWGSANSIPRKWQSAPFNNDWPSSLFASQDPVAIDSVGLDFLTMEDATINSGYPCSDNYLHEAALADDPPSGTFYDPEGDGSGLASQGVHEHWNSSLDKQYTRNLGTGEGIELFVVPPDSTPPTAPADLEAADVRDDRVVLAWTAAADPESGVASYRVYRDGGRIATVAATQFTDTDVAALTDYTYEVSAVNGDGLEGPRSNALLVRTPADETPPVLDVVWARSATEVEMTFSEAVAEETAEALGHYALDGGGVVSAAALQADGRTVRLTTSALASGQTYTLAVAAVEDLVGNPVPDATQARFAWTPGPVVLTFQQGAAGYAGTADTMLQEASPDAANGAAALLGADTDDPSGSGRAMQTLLVFGGLFGTGPGQIPPHAQVTSASLQLQVTDAGSALGLHRMLVPWTEADTWNTLAGGVQADGAEAVASADVTTGAVSTGVLTIDVTASLAAWAAAPGARYGWAILPTGTNGVDFYSSEGTTPPKLTVTFMPSGPNRAPSAVAEAYEVAEDGRLAVPAPGVLAGDADPDADALAAVLRSDVSHGTLTLRPDGSFDYEPAADSFGTDSFVYRASDGGLQSRDTTVTLTVTGVNDAPVLDAGPEPTLADVDAGAGDPAGTAVADLLGAAVTDADGPGALAGIAVTAADAAHGAWQYRLEGSGEWLALGPVSDTAARLLRAEDRVRFVPGAGFLGTAALAYRAWDQTSGAAGGTADASVAGGMTAFSDALETAAVAVVIPATMTWLGGAGDRWDDGANWSATVPPGPATLAVFDAPLAHGPCLYEDTAVGGIAICCAGVTLDAAGHTLTVGSGGIDSAGTGTNTVEPNVALGTDSTWTVGDQNTLVLNGAFSGGDHTLTKDGDGTLVLNGGQDYGTGLSLAVNAGSVRLGSGQTLVLKSLTGGSASTLDVADGNLVVDYEAGSTPLVQVTDWVRSGFTDGPGGWWDGPGIQSSAAANDVTYATALGVLDNSHEFLGGLTQFGGVPVDPDSVLVKSTWWGDIDFDGQVTLTDYSVFLYYFFEQENMTPDEMGWWSADLDYDGRVTLTDYNLLLYGFLTQTGPLGAGDVAGGDPVAVFEFAAVPSGQVESVRGTGGDTLALAEGMVSREPMLAAMDDDTLSSAIPSLNLALEPLESGPPAGNFTGVLAIVAETLDRATADGPVVPLADLEPGEPGLDPAMADGLVDLLSLPALAVLAV